jgi:hypothetical protein
LSEQRSGREKNPWVVVVVEERRRGEIERSRRGGPRECRRRGGLSVGPVLVLSSLVGWRPAVAAADPSMQQSPGRTCLVWPSPGLDRACLQLSSSQTGGCGGDERDVGLRRTRGTTRGVSVHLQPLGSTFSSCYSLVQSR